MRRISPSSRGSEPPHPPAAFACDPALPRLYLGHEQSKPIGRRLRPGERSLPREARNPRLAPHGPGAIFEGEPRLDRRRGSCPHGLLGLRLSGAAHDLGTGGLLASRPKRRARQRCPAPAHRRHPRARGREVGAGRGGASIDGSRVDRSHCAPVTARRRRRCRRGRRRSPAHPRAAGRALRGSSLRAPAGWRRAP